MSILSTRNSSELLLPLTHGLFLLRRNLKNKKNMDRGETRPKPQHVILLWGASVGREGQRRIRTALACILSLPLFCSLWRLKRSNGTQPKTGLINHLRWIYIYRYTTQRESDLTYGQVWWLILRICALQLTHPKCTHTQQWTHTHTLNTHPEPVGSHLCCGARGAVGGSVPCSSALKVERALDIHSPHLQSLPDQTQTRNLWIMSPTLLPLGHVFPFARYHDCFISTSEENPSLDLPNLVWFVISNSKKMSISILKYWSI